MLRSFATICLVLSVRWGYLESVFHRTLALCITVFFDVDGVRFSYSFDALKSSFLVSNPLFSEECLSLFDSCSDVISVLNNLLVFFWCPAAVLWSTAVTKANVVSGDISEVFEASILVVDYCS